MVLLQNAPTLRAPRGLESLFVSFFKTSIKVPFVLRFSLYSFLKLSLLMAVLFQLQGLAL